MVCRVWLPESDRAAAKVHLVRARAPPLGVSDYGDIERRQAQHRYARALVRYLVRNATQPERVGLRVLLLAYHFQEPEGREKQQEFAARLGLDPARVSAGLRELRDVLNNLETASFQAGSEDPGKLPL
jgi:hypothetical protein